MMESNQPADPLATPRFAGISTFMRLPWITDLDQLDAAFIGIPFDGGQSFRTGSRFAPRAVREISSGIKAYNAPMKVHPFKKYRVADFGDFVTNPFSLDDSHRRISEQMDKVLEADVLPICLGGDQSMTLPILRSMVRKHGRLSLLMFNAHHDTFDKYFGVKQYSAGTFFRRAVEENLIDPRQSVMLGLRGPTFDENDFGYCEEQGVRIVTMDDVYDNGLDVALEAMNQVRGNKCYVTIDIDAVDPAFAPGTTLPTPGGFTSADAIRMIRHLKQFDAVGFDIVELQPNYDHGGITAMLVGMLAYEFLCTR